ncbi:subtilase-type protease inhibitor [Streptomyces sp. NPDC054784]
MRNPIRSAMAIPLLSAGALLALSGTATAEPASLYAPSALTLTVAEGGDASAAAPARAVTLSCRPTDSGTHPAPAAACAELRGVHGDFTALGASGTGACPMVYAPVVVTAQGVWEGERVDFERTYGNGCVLAAEGTPVFDF